MTNSPYMCVYVPVGQQARIDEHIGAIRQKTEQQKSRSAIIREVLFRCLQKLSDPKTDLEKPVSIRFYL